MDTGLRCLVTGATGYIGGRLVPRLLSDTDTQATPAAAESGAEPGAGAKRAPGHSVRVLVRSPSKLRDVPWAARVDVAKGDVTDYDSMRTACEGIDVLYYLVHSLGAKGFEDLDTKGAAVAARAAKDAGVKRIVYLGGLRPQGVPVGKLSPHLRSRTEVGQILLDSGVPTAVLQAAVILGSGSASFEMLRYLTERLPAMVTPRWVSNRIQPIAVRDVLRYLVGCAQLPPDVNRTFDIGGPDVLTYREMMQRYARVAGLPKRVIVPVGVLTPSLSAHWVNVVTPVPRSIAVPLVQSLVHEVVCHEHDIVDYVPNPPEGLLGYDHAVQAALSRIRADAVETSWSWASTPGAASDPLPSDPDWSGGSSYSDVRERRTDASPSALWHVVEGIGGENGWYSFPLAWTVRGWADRLVGGVGLRRGRRDRDHLYVGEALDWWRVEEIEAGRLLRLRAEMRVPGRAWLELMVQAEEAGATYRQRAVFLPRGLFGHAYWYASAPFHGYVFGGMVRNITKAAERVDAAERPTTSNRPQGAPTVASA